jgi:hypothetical protein
VEPSARSDNGKATITAERRRPGRIETSNPHLIKLLRRPEEISPAIEDEAIEVLSTRIQDEIDTDLLAPAKGIILGLAISIAIWVLIGLAGWFLL